jgi:hypothetical protein
VAQVVDGKTLVLERPLPWDILPEYKPSELHVWAPTMYNIGIEGLKFTMKPSRYLGHFMETGYDVINWDSVANSFIRGACAPAR